MGAFISLSQALSEIMDGLTQGFEMFGDNVIWFWLLPPVWSIAACLIWMKIESDEEEGDRLYVTNAEQNLPRLKELVKQRSTEILEIRPGDRGIR